MLRVPRVDISVNHNIETLHAVLVRMPIQVTPSPPKENLRRKKRVEAFKDRQPLVSVNSTSPKTKTKGTMLRGSVTYSIFLRDWTRLGSVVQDFRAT